LLKPSNCRFATALVALTGTGEALADVAWEVELGPVVVIGACWVTFMFVMLSVNGDELPVKFQATLV